MQGASMYWFFPFLNYLIFPILICFSIGVLYNTSIKKKYLLLCFFITFLSIFIQVINNAISHRILLFIAGPILGYWVYKCSFKSSILVYSFGGMIILLLFFYAKHYSFENLFPEVSSNYLSILMITNVALIAGIELKQHETISILPAFGGFLLSLLAMGRSGILCSALLLLWILLVRINGLSTLWKLVFILGLFLIIGVIFKFYSPVDTLNNMEVLGKFNHKGLDSHVRTNLINEYLSHINEKTILLGYDYKDNPYYMVYKHPHNSYFALHHQIGFVSFILLFYIVKYWLKVLKKNIVAFIILFSLILRAYTDVYLFPGYYDFIIYFLLITFSGYNTNEESDHYRCRRHGAYLIRYGARKCWI